jgi:hypothetical protein
MLSPRYYRLSLVLVVFMSMSCLLRAQLGDEEGAATLEPFPLTQALIDELTQATTNVNAGNPFTLKGLTITLTNQTASSISLLVTTDARLNLWCGRPNDLAGSHAGTMKMNITAITDDSGTNIHDTSRDERWANRIVIYRQKDGIFQGGRSANIKKASAESRITRVSGKIELTLPLNSTKYVVKPGAQETTKAMLARGDITAVKFMADGIEISSPSDRPLTVMAFDDKGARVAITGKGAGWYRVNQEISIGEMHIFIPDKMVRVEIPFSIDVKAR